MDLNGVGLTILTSLTLTSLTTIYESFFGLHPDPESQVLDRTNPLIEMY